MREVEKSQTDLEASASGKGEFGMRIAEYKKVLKRTGSKMDSSSNT